MRAISCSRRSANHPAFFLSHIDNFFHWSIMLVFKLTWLATVLRSSFLADLSDEPFLLKALESLNSSHLLQLFLPLVLVMVVFLESVRPWIEGSEDISWRGCHLVWTLWKRKLRPCACKTATAMVLCYHFQIFKYVNKYINQLSNPMIFLIAFCISSLVGTNLKYKGPSFILLTTAFFTPFFPLLAIVVFFG